jgi:hypothetical protein
VAPKAGSQNMADQEIEQILIDLKKQREVIERDMNDTDRNINAAELLERIELLKKRIESTRAIFGVVAPGPETLKPTT